jgi:hypothetical protein
MKSGNLKSIKRRINSGNVSLERLSVDSTAMNSIDSDFTLFPTRECSLFTSVKTPCSQKTEPHVHISSFCSERITQIQPCSYLITENIAKPHATKLKVTKPPRPELEKDSIKVWIKNTSQTSNFTASFLEKYRRTYSNSYSGERNGAKEIIPLRVNTSALSSHKWKSSSSKRRVLSAHFEEDKLSSRPWVEDSSCLESLLSKLGRSERILRQEDNLGKVRELRQKMKQSVSKSYHSYSLVASNMSNSSSYKKISIMQRAQVPSSKIEISRCMSDI